MNSDKIDKEGVLNKTPSFCFKRAARGVFALAKSRKVFAELFAKSDLLCPQALGVFFVSFLLRLLCQKKAEFRIMPYKTAVNLQK